MRSRYASYAWLVLGFNLLVILWGAVVRATGSGAGCGSHWPLCDGVVLPRDPAVATVIELSHRATSGIALLLVIGLAVGAWRRHPPRHRVRRGAVCAVLFIFTEALIGAGIVLLEYVADDTRAARALWVSGHLVNTFLLLAALALTAWWASGAPPVRLRRRERTAVPLGLVLAAFLVLGMSGAVTALGDTLFPVSSLAEGKALTFSPTAHLFVRLRVWHPALAVAVGACLASLCLHVRRLRPSSPVRRLGEFAAGLYVIQLAIGAVNVWLLAPIFLQIVHLLLTDMIWITLVLFGASVLAETANAGSGGVASGTAESSSLSPPDRSRR